ncbi:MAG TPA: hypothetical protein VF290_18130 [Pyrinomonadaceae bacterium]
MSTQQSEVSRTINIALEAMRAANLLTPAIAQIFSIVKKGREDGKDDEAVKREAMDYVNGIIGKADAQLAVKPDQA